MICNVLTSFSSARWLLAALVLVASTASYAQERAAAYALDTEATWAQISSKLQKSSMASDMANVRIDQSAKCGAKGLAYAPGIQGADNDGCLAPYYSNEVINKFIACGNQALVYSQATDRCQSNVEKVPVCNMVTTSITGNQNSGITCPSGYTHISTVFAGYKKPRYRDGCETCNPQYTTTCGKMVCEYK